MAWARKTVLWIKNILIFSLVIFVTVRLNNLQRFVYSYWDEEVKFLNYDIHTLRSQDNLTLITG